MDGIHFKNNGELVEVYNDWNDKRRMDFLYE